MTWILAIIVLGLVIFWPDHPHHPQPYIYGEDE